MPVNYQEGKIYKIYNAINGDIYIGSTTQQLCNIMTGHRRNIYKNSPIYKAFREQGVENFFIELVEKCPCNGKDGLIRTEGKYIRELNPSLNKVIAGRTRKEHYIDNKEHLSQRAKEWREDNKGYMAQKVKELREDNKDYVNTYYGERITCECGCVVRRDGILRHRRSAKHKRLLNEYINFKKRIQLLYIQICRN